MAKATKKNASTREDILKATINELKNKFGDGAIMKLGDSVKTKVDVIPSGVLQLDVALGIGGYPKGRIVEIFGPEGSGKTTMALCAIAEAQKAGGIAAFIDAEHALDPKLAATLGVNINDLYLSQPDSGEQALFITNELVRSGAVDIVVVDSVAALTPQAEIDGKILIGENQVGLQARLMSNSLRRLASVTAKTNCIIIFINQLRANIQTGYAAGPTETTTGGRALKFYSSVRLEVRRGKKIEKGDVTIGHELYLKVVKNKLSPPFRTAHASLIYGQGIPLGVAVVDMGVDFNVINKKGSWLYYKGETLAQGKESAAKFLAEHKELQDEILNEVMKIAGSGVGFVVHEENLTDIDGETENESESENENKDVQEEITNSDESMNNFENENENENEILDISEDEK